MEVRDNTEMRHFEVRENGELAFIEYQVQEKKYFLTRVEFPEEFTRDGLDQQMIGKVLDIIEETGMRVVPMTKVIKQYFKDNPGRKKLLPVGIHF